VAGVVGASRGFLSTDGRIVVELSGESGICLECEGALDECNGPLRQV